MSKKTDDHDAWMDPGAEVLLTVEGYTKDGRSDLQLHLYRDCDTLNSGDLLKPMTLTVKESQICVACRFRRIAKQRSQAKRKNKTKEKQKK